MITRRGILLTGLILALAATWLVSFRSVRHVEPVIVLGTISYAPPHVMAEGGGHQGLDIDIATEIAQALQKKLVIKVISQDILLPSLQEKMVDFVMGGQYVSPDVPADIEMFPYLEVPLDHLHLVFLNKVPLACTSGQELTLESLSCLMPPMVGIEAFSEIEEIVRRAGAPCEVKQINHGSLLSLLADGTASALLVKPAVYERLKKDNPSIQSLVIALKPEEQLKEFGVAVRKADKDFALVVRNAIQALNNKGFIKEKYQCWLEQAEYPPKNS